MKTLLIPAAAVALFAFSTAAYAQQPGEPQPTQPEAAQTQEQQEDLARAQLANTYANILFGQEIENRCNHLQATDKSTFEESVKTVDGYMQTRLPPETVNAVKDNAAAAGSDVESNPCGEDSERFVIQIALLAKQVSDNIKHQKN